ncbi:Leucine-rich repeat (LRR) protein [Flavobacterium sp. 2755]|uniref:leucine-rich repeat domain-containing protein n=1 Tax=Flavobacterium sp. 2755 TaxID=2817765 RepID=UPI002863B868|nr:immunoglobulin domain-containing protein [Flavobacterium sp. 2755]MDR6764547.1 Leucine-rich repeat (LRR) protein [Flavobacterium sp. 2755]
MFNSLTAVTGQVLSDETIGFNVDRVKSSLKEHGVANEDLDREIAKEREVFTILYKEMKKNEIDTLTLQAVKKDNTIAVNNKTNRMAVMAAETPTIETQRAALIALYNSTNGPNWRSKTGWDVNNPDLSKWYGVYLSNNQVYRIDLGGNNLSGSIPPEIKNLPYLKELRLDSNNLTGEIPKEIGELKQLQVLQILTNKLSGPIPPEIGNLTNLEYMYMSQNQLSGSIPPEIGNLKSLKTLSLGDNLLSGSIPPQIGNMESLIDIGLTLNQLSGTLPVEMGNLKLLTGLVIQMNNLSGSIPVEIFNMKKLTTLALNNNNFTSLPNDSNLSTNLIYLYLAYNKISGNIPGNLFQSNTLRGVDLSYNLFDGTLPIEIKNCTSFYLFKINNNQLSGNLDFLPSQQNPWYGIDVSSNKFSGKVPNLTTSSSLKVLLIGANNFYFNDFVNEFSSYKATKTAFSFSPQAKTDTPKTITVGQGKNIVLSMFENGNFHPEDTYQWFKDGVEIAAANSRTYVLNNATLSDAGTYTCKAYHLIPDMSPLVLEREPLILNVLNCDLLTGKITSPSEEFCISQQSAFTFETTAANLTYKWSAIASTGLALDIPPDSNANYAYTFANPGSYIIKLEVTDAAGCTANFSKSIEVVAACVPENVCISQPVNMSFETQSVNLNYKWIIKDTSNNIIEEVSNTTGTHYFLFPTLGLYHLDLVVTSEDGCSNNFTKDIYVIDCKPCDYCASFNLVKNEKYLVSGWVKEVDYNLPNLQVKNYSKSSISISFTDISGTDIGVPFNFHPSGEIIDGWQRIIGEFIVPNNVDDMKLDLVNESTTNGKMVYFDDIRILPTKGNMKSFVYDQQTQRLMAELDENNYATFYEYDLEGGLVRVKKETEKGVFTIQETRSGNSKNDTE